MDVAAAASGYASDGRQATLAIAIFQGVMVAHEYAELIRLT